MAELRVGVIGCGSIANRKHLPALKTEKRVEIVAFCDIVVERAQQAANEYGIAGAGIYEDYRKLLEDTSIDVVHVCTPNVSHCEISVAAMEAGKHVLCEKPMAITGADAKKMVDTAKRTGKKLTIGYQNRFRPDATFLRNVIDEGHIGEIYYGKAHAIRRRAVPTWGVFTDKQKQGGGPLIDIGTHALDLTLWYMGNYEVESVMGVSYEKLGNDPLAVQGNLFGPWNPKTYEVEDSAMGFIRMKNGASISLESSWALNTLDVREAMCTLMGRRGGAEMLHDPYGGYTCRLNMTMGKQLVQVLPDIAVPVAYQMGTTETDGERELHSWVDALLNNTDPVVMPEQAMVVSQVLEAIYTSSKTGKAVEF